MNKTRALHDLTRVMLHTKHLVLQFWAEAVNSICSTLNRVSIRPVIDKMCYKIWKGKKSMKLDAKGEEWIYVGYLTNSRTYSGFLNRSRKVIESFNGVVKDYTGTTTSARKFEVYDFEHVSGDEEDNSEDPDTETVQNLEERSEQRGITNIRSSKKEGKSVDTTLYVHANRNVGQMKGGQMKGEHLEHKLTQKLIGSHKRNLAVIQHLIGSRPDVHRNNHQIYSDDNQTEKEYGGLPQEEMTLRLDLSLCTITT